MADGEVDEEVFQTVRVDSWGALMDALEDEVVMRHWPKQGSHWRSPYVFRGLDSVKYDLETTLQRLQSPPAKVEGPLLRSFLKYVPPGTQAAGSSWETIALAQHNGLPTRLLDWTSSPLIAVHFATADKKRFDEPGVVWCVDVEAVHHQPTALATQLQESGAFVYFVDLLDRLFPTLNALDEYPDTGPAGTFMLFFEPPSLDARIQNQRGLLSVANGPSRDQHAHLRQLAGLQPNAVRRIVIESRAKPKIRDMLDQSNITERVLFPGLPGLCQWLARYYGPSLPASS